MERYRDVVSRLESVKWGLESVIRQLESIESNLKFRPWQYIPWQYISWHPWPWCRYDGEAEKARLREAEKAWLREAEKAWLREAEKARLREAEKARLEAEKAQLEAKKAQLEAETALLEQLLPLKLPLNELQDELRKCRGDGIRKKVLEACIQENKQKAAGVICAHVGGKTGVLGRDAIFETRRFQGFSAAGVKYVSPKETSDEGSRIYIMQLRNLQHKTPTLVKQVVKSLVEDQSKEYVYESEVGESRLTPNDLFTVYTELLEASDSWYNLGLSLGLSPEFLDQVKEGHPDSAACLLDVLGTWLQGGQNRTWGSVVVALRSRGVGEHSLAKRLERKYCQEGVVLHQDHLGILHEELYSASSKWRQLGLQLGVSASTLNSIRHNFSSPSDCLREVLKEWLRKGTVTTWEALIAALRQPIVGEHRLADQLERPLCGMEGEEEFVSAANELPVFESEEETEDECGVSTLPRNKGKAPLNKPVSPKKVKMKAHPNMQPPSVLEGDVGTSIAAEQDSNPTIGKPVPPAAVNKGFEQLPQIRKRKRKLSPTLEDTGEYQPQTKRAYLDLGITAQLQGAQQLTPTTACDILKAAEFSLADSEELASRLIGLAVAKTIKDTYPAKPSLCLQNVIAQWLQMDPNASWLKLADEVSKVNGYGAVTAGNIRSKAGF